MDIRVVGYAHPDARRLVAEVQQEYVRRYGDVDLTPVEPADFELPRGLFAVVYDQEGRAVGTGAWRAREAGEQGLADGDAELKRMYTVPSARGRGLARLMLRFLEDEARRAGRRRVVLETGNKQPEALALYASEGYLPTEKFGIYRDHPDSVCLAKQLDDEQPGPATERQADRQPGQHTEPQAERTGAPVAAQARMG
ncbi:GNAT superfamily N-acetyltransferase [Streptacidiphilus sp. MAP12-16]|uniref:GNAT family N-acetyltransferase n=1 Tax=Streptacidiphilus sp. MAP12-16 TaxID=3156300 RepID=UPI0035157F03